MPAMPAKVKEEFELTGYPCMPNGEKQKNVVDVSYPGLTKREMFAIHAMQGLLSSDDSSICFYKNNEGAKDIAQSAVAYADALLAELGGE